MSMPFSNTLEYAKSLDNSDPIKSYRNRFFIPQHNGKDCIYLCGNSLGLQPKSVQAHIQQELDDWANLGVEGHFDGQNPWMYYHHLFSAPVARLVGAKENEVVVMNTLTTNLHLLMGTFYKPTATRYKIVIEEHAFPSDHYVVESQLAYHGFDWKDGLIELKARDGEHTLRTRDILDKLDEHASEIALILIGGVNYYTGQLFDMAAITEKGHSIGAKVGFDLAHAAGNVELQLHAWDVDFAAWCSYKYLNSGPGGPSGIFIHERFGLDPKTKRFAGWWGHDEESRFEMKPGYIPMKGAQGWQLSNAQIMAMAPHKASMEIFDEVGMKALNEKSTKMTSYLEFLLNDINEGQFEIITPQNESERGCQLSLLTDASGPDIYTRIKEAGVIADWREPNVIRIAPVPLYNSFEDCWRFAQLMKQA